MMNIQIMLIYKIKKKDKIDNQKNKINKIYAKDKIF